MTPQLKNYILIVIVAIAIAFWIFGTVEITVILAGMTTIWQWFESRWEKQAHENTKASRNYYKKQLESRLSHKK